MRFQAKKTSNLKSRAAETALLTIKNIKIYLKNVFFYYKNYKKVKNIAKPLGKTAKPPFLFFYFYPFDLPVRAEGGLNLLLQVTWGAAIT